MMRAYAGTLAVITLPGLLVALILGLRLRMLVTWAAIPAFSLATVFVLGEVTIILHVPFAPPAFAALLVVLIGLLAVARRHRSKGSRVPPDHAPRDNPALQPIAPWLGDRVEYGLLALGLAIGASTWVRGLRGLPLVPAGGDATRHGWFVGRILFSHTIDPAKVVTSDVAGKHAVAKYYPLALHASAALSTRIAATDAGRVLVAYIVVFSAVVLPVGMFVLARMLAPSRPLIAGFTALVVPLLMVFPYYPVRIGDVPQTAAMALVPVTVVLVFGATLARRPQLRLDRACIMALAPAALAILCTISVHASELPLIIFLLVLLALEEAWREHDALILQNALARSAAVGAFAIVLFAPTLVSFARGVSERLPVETFVPTPAGWEQGLGAFLQLQYGPGTERQGFLALLALAGAAVWLMRRRPAWVAGWAGVVVLSALTSASKSRIVKALTFPWYHVDWRVLINVAFFVPFFAGVTLAYGADVIARVSKQSRAVLPGTLVMMAVFFAFVGVRGYHADNRYVRGIFDADSQAFRNQAVVAPSSLAAFRWLHDHVAPGDTVADEPNVDGSLWMYPLEHVSPLVGMISGKTSPELADRLFLTERLQLIGRNAVVDDIAHRYQTRWVYFDSHLLPVDLTYRVMSLAALQRNPNLTPVFHRGGSWVFRIDL